MSVVVSFLLCTIAGLSAFYISPGIKYRQIILLLCSFAFVWFISPASTIVVLLFSIYTYYAAKIIAASSKKTITYFIFLCFLSSIFFIYNVFENYQTQELNFFKNSGFDLSKWIIIGIGFYTLQHIAYLTDVKNKTISPEVKFIPFLLSSLFYTKFISGPIVKTQVLATAFASLNSPFHKKDFAIGIQRLLLGLVKKIVIADRLATYVTMSFESNHSLPGWDILVALITFTLQLYFDFSGYIDMAIGASLLFGITLPENFNRPFRSKSIAEFWRSWHITLINWFTQYLFYPINYKLRKNPKLAVLVSITVTFLISGLWHGVNITYLIWAFCHFVYLSFEFLTRSNTKRTTSFFGSSIKAVGSVLLTFSLVCFSNLFFRAPDLHKAYILLKELFDYKNFFPWTNHFSIWLINGGGNIELVFNLRFGLGLAIIYLLFEHTILKWTNNTRYMWIYMSLGFFILALFGVFDSAAQFIYLQF